ncbi:MAG: hypothetical protein NT034_03350 [Candidatus Magasanikbacteria bacterium]|nr:hypothetical protein [Candidatus Magasanikbacteria bacterium]
MSISAIKYTDLPKDLFVQNFSWQKPEKIPGLGLVVNQFTECDGPGCNGYAEKDSTYYRVATFSYQQKTGEVFLLPLNHSSFSGYNFAQYYFINFNGALSLLEKNSTPLDSVDGLNKVKFLVNKNLSLPENTTVSKELNITGKQKLYLEGEEESALFIDDEINVGGIKREKIAYFDNKDIWNCGDFFVTFTNNIEGIQPLTYNIKLPKIFNLNNGQKENVHDYDSKRDTGCGGRRGLNVLNTLKESDLEKIGTADDGNAIFRYKDTSEGSADSEFFKNYKGYMENINSPTALTYDKFLANNPIVVMKDGFGRYIQFIKSEFFFSMAECGKPVIYLYPKTETKVNVQVKPNGGLTKVDPFYPTDGWMVNAKPNGDLTNTSDNQNYPYLFWEGNAYNMKIPTDGFVLKRENVKRDIPKLLSLLGLNKKETKDFLEFWQTKLEIKPYVFVTFVSQTDFDKVAPLNISPRPDKIIRVFMDYQPLDFPVAVRPLKIETPTRTGFTVVEWGGRLHQ